MTIKKEPKIKWKSIRVKTDTLRLFKIKAAKEQCSVYELADQLIRRA